MKQKHVLYRLQIIHKVTVYFDVGIHKISYDIKILEVDVDGIYMNAAMWT